LLKDVKRETPAPEGTEYLLKTRLVLRSSTTFSSKHDHGKAKPTAKRATKAKTEK
jgi:hypothetical protein